MLLSNHQSCQCGDDYLVSIAAFGNPKLVKPKRYGVRRGKLILTTRQLLVVNAFESWLEQYTPRLHKKIRKIYDGMNIPADKLAKKKRIANFLFVLMKPAEWFCLMWLYAFDKNPESRIARQYLPENKL